MLSFGTIQDVSRHTGLGWHTIKGIDYEYLRKHYSKPRLKEVRNIAIDEFAVQKGHKYMTVVMDLETGQVLYVAEGKDAQSLDKFWKSLRSSGAKIEAVSIDMSSAYIKAVSENIPKARVVFDWFHIVKQLNDKVDELRREMSREEKNAGKRKVKKGVRWLLLKRGYNLKAEKNERERLEEALQMNKPLATMYYMKEELPLMWEERNKTQALIVLKEWCQRAQASGIKQLQKFANMLMVHRRCILNWYNARISTGPLEGLNNKIKVLKRKAYGYRDQEFFKLKILALHDYKIRYALLR